MTQKWYRIKWCLEDTVQTSLIKSRFKFQARFRFRKSAAHFLKNSKDVQIISILKRN
jgi:hypothetical protein